MGIKARCLKSELRELTITNDMAPQSLGRVALAATRYVLFVSRETFDANLAVVVIGD